MAVLTILGFLAAIIIPRVTDGNDDAKIAACKAHKGNIEVQAELWLHDTGSWPAANLAIIGADLDYFPTGLPTCPLDGSSYTIDPQTGQVLGHNH